MKKKLVLVVLVAALFLGVTGTAMAEIRLDFDIPWLLAVGVNTSDVTGSTTNSVDLSSYHFPLPYVELAYQFGEENAFIRGGLGLRTYTILIEFIGWPMAYVEVEPLERLVLRAERVGSQSARGREDHLVAGQFVDEQLGHAHTSCGWSG